VDRRLSDFYDSGQATFLRRHAASPARPEARRSRVEGSGMGADPETALAVPVISTRRPEGLLVPSEVFKTLKSMMFIPATNPEMIEKGVNVIKPITVLVVSTELRNIVPLLSVDH